MNWIILIVAGFFESGFAFCLGKMKEASGTGWYLWGTGFLLSLTLWYCWQRQCRHCLSVPPIRCGQVLVR